MPPLVKNIAKQILKYCRIFACDKNIRKFLKDNPMGFSLEQDLILEKWEKRQFTKLAPPPNHVVVILYNDEPLVKLVWEPEYNYYDAALKFYLPAAATYCETKSWLEISYMRNYFSRTEAKLLNLPDSHREIPKVSILRESDRLLVPNEIVMIKNKIIS